MKKQRAARRAGEGEVPKTRAVGARADWISAGIAIAALMLAVVSQLPGRAEHAEIKETTETYLLPPPKQLAVMSMGYRAAVADVLWANVLVTQGLRMGERRRFDLAIEYVDAINELDPKWRDPYRMVDSLVTLQVKAAPLDQVYAVRRILERGVKERPTDAELWLVLGYFVQSIVPNSYLEDDPEEAEKWRREGAEYLFRAAELAPADANIAWQSLGGARVFSEMGRFDRAIEMYNTILATTEDPALRARIETQLLELQRQQRVTGAQLYGRARRRAFENLMIEHYPGVSVHQALIMGHPRSVGACAGGGQSVFGSKARCAKSWRRWEELDPSGSEEQ